MATSKKYKSRRRLIKPFYLIKIMLDLEAVWIAWESPSEPLDIYDIHDVGMVMNFDENRKK